MFSSWKYPPGSDGANISQRRQVFNPVTAKTAVPRACSYCRGRKVRCTGEKSGCKRCRMLGKQCVYAPLKQPPSRPHRRAEVVDAKEPPKCGSDGEAAYPQSPQVASPASPASPASKLPAPHPHAESLPEQGRRGHYLTPPSGSRSPPVSSTDHGMAVAAPTSIYESISNWERFNWACQSPAHTDFSAFMLDDASFIAGMESSPAARMELLPLTLDEGCDSPSASPATVSTPMTGSSHEVAAVATLHGSDFEIPESYAANDKDLLARQPQTSCQCLHRIVLLTDELDSLHDDASDAADNALAVHKAALEQGDRMLNCSACRTKVENMTLLSFMTDKLARLCRRLAVDMCSKRSLPRIPNTFIGAYTVDSPLEYINLLCSLLGSQLHRLHHLTRQLQYVATQFRSETIRRRIESCNKAIGEARRSLESR